MTRLTEDDPISISIPKGIGLCEICGEHDNCNCSKIVDKYHDFNDPFTNYCPDCEGTGYSNLDDREEYDIDFRLETCSRCKGSGELRVSSNGVVQENEN